MARPRTSRPCGAGCGRVAGDARPADFDPRGVEWQYLRNLCDVPSPVSLHLPRANWNRPDLHPRRRPGACVPRPANPSKCMGEDTMLHALVWGYHARATGHGFRSTAGTTLNEQGFRPDVIERQLARGERNGVRAAYDHHTPYLPERREVMQWWADCLDGVPAKE